MQIFPPFFRDISKRAFVSRFSAARASIYQFFPINLFSWQRNGSVSTDASLELTNTATTSLFSKHSEKSSFCPSVGEDSAIWLLVSTISDSDAQHNCMSRDCQKNPVRFWRLALLVKNRVILGSPLDPRCYVVYCPSFNLDFLITEIEQFFRCPPKWTCSILFDHCHI